MKVRARLRHGPAPTCPSVFFWTTAGPARSRGGVLVGLLAVQEVYPQLEALPKRPDRPEPAVVREQIDAVPGGDVPPVR